MANLLDIVTKGSTNRSLTLRMADSADGTPETGVASGTPGLDVWYRREGSTKQSLTESDLTALDDAHSDGGLLHISDGEYRVDFPDATFATGAQYVDVGWGATDMVGFGGRVRLTDVDVEDSVRAGLTALPDAAADAAGGLPISDAGGLDLDSRLDAAISSRSSHSANDVRDAVTGGAWSLDTDSNGRIRIVDGTGVGELDTSSGLIAGIAGTKNTLDDLNDISTAQVNSEADTALSDFFTSSAQLVDDIWDEVITAAQHNVNTSAAKFLREASEAITGVTGTAQGATSTTLQLASGAISNDDIFNGERVTIIEGTGAGQSRLIKDSTASNDTVDLFNAWTVTPDATSVYAIMGAETDLRSVTGFDALATANVDFDDLAAILLDTDELQQDDVPGLISALNDPAANEIRDAVTGGAWSLDTDSNGRIRVVSGVGAGEISLSSGLIDGITGTKNTFDDLNDLAQSEVTGGAYALDTDANGRIRIVDGTGAGELDTNAGLIVGIAGTKNTLDDLNDLSASEVNTEVADVLTVDTRGEPGQTTPPATTSIAVKLDYLYKAWRNKSDQDGSSYKLYADDESTIDQKRTISEASGTVTLEEVATGP